MIDAVEKIMALWRELPEDDAAARAAFAEVYAETVTVNDVDLSLDDLVTRARSALTDELGLRSRLHAVALR